MLRFPSGAPMRLALLSALLFSALAQAQVSNVKIGVLQGTSHKSAFENQQATGIRGIVTARDNNGFWIQDSGDGNPLTSDAIYIFVGASGSKPAVGADVTVGGKLLEFRPGNDANNLTLTEISATAANSGSVLVNSLGNALPAARVIGAAGSLIPNAIAPNVGNVETHAGYTLQPGLYAMDFYESLEGMRVSMASAVSTSPTLTGDYNGDTFVVSRGQLGTGVMSPRGGVVLAAGQYNGHRIAIDNRMASSLGLTMPTVNVGAQIDNITGVIDYSFANYRLLLTATPTVTASPLVAEIAAPRGAGQLGFATYNVENLGGNASAARITEVVGQMRVNLQMPEVLALQEIQDNNGSTNNGVVAADVTLTRMTDEIKATTGKDYGFLTINPVNNADGGQTGGNIRQAFLYDKSVVSFDAGKQTGGALDAVSAVLGGDGQIELQCGAASFACIAGRIDPTNAAFSSSRKPLVMDMNVGGQQIIVISNHFNSKGGDQPLFGPNQPAVNDSETQRLAQAQAVAAFVQGILAIKPNANIIVTGDLNDFQFAGSLQPLYGAGLHNMVDTLAPGERYTYNYQGNAQALDHMFVSANLLGAASLDIVHANSEFRTQVSDHDPLLMTLNLAAIPEPQTVLMMLAGLGLLSFRRRKAS